MAYPNETKRRIKWLRNHGFTVGARDERMNTAFVGTWMVAENYILGHTQEDARGGVWCIVGNSLAQIVDDAYENFYDGKVKPVMQNVWLIKHRCANLWWNSYGWNGDKRTASRYTTTHRNGMRQIPDDGEWYQLFEGEL